MKILAHWLLGAAFIAALTSLVSAQPAAGEEPVELATEWPELEDASRVKKDVGRLRKARTEEMASQALEALSADGAGVAPLLLKALGKERDEDARARIQSVLDAATRPEHAQLLASEFASKSNHVRTWSLRRVAQFREARIQTSAVEALGRLTAKPKPEDADYRSELLAAALCTTASGATEGLDTLHDAATKRWQDDGGAIRHSLEALRTSEAHKLVTPKLTGDRDAKVGALRLLAGCGNESTIPAVAPFLDSSDNTLRVEAINALRGIVDGDPPVERLPVFEAIERAGKWKERL